ncbi:MAG: ABC-F family ATP-binding cassette domain-containing protein [Chitinispirillaceae bacterium]|nr:ABC-F family ATP-binding cassette domain-containing protein [Chitinispirillaceae bacterium]
MIYGTTTLPPAMITLDHVSKQYGGEMLLDDVSVAFHESERTGLVGVNGSGKTTLMRMLAGETVPDKGSIQKASDCTIGYLHQEVEVFDEHTPMEIVLQPFAHLLDFEKKLEELGHAVNRDGTTGHKALRKIEELHHAVEFHDVYSLQSRAESILAGLGVPLEKWRRPLSELSGGYRMRVVLGKLLLLSPGYLLLDEPTNHLDMDSLVWLEKFLDRYEGGMMIISHDRDFLNRMTGCTAEISNRAITMYRGNYDEFLTMRELVREQARNRFRNLQLQIAEKERFVERFKAKNTKATQAASRLKQIEKLREQLPEIPEESGTIDFTFARTVQSGGVPLKLCNVSVRYGETDVFSGLSMEIRRGDRVAVVGPNGSGKSTLLKLMAGDLKPWSGTCEAGYNTIVRYFGQHQLEQLDQEKTVEQTVAETAVKTEKTFIRNILGAFLFSGDDAVAKKVGVLSGGEKSRLVFATMLASPGNTLLLDEPTNHLDINSVETLLRALEKFTGTIVLVSHDEYFVSRIAGRVIEMRPGLIRDFPGTLADYRTYVEEGLWGNRAEGDAVKPGRSQEDAKDKERRIRERVQRKKAQRAVQKLEREIEAREEGMARLRGLLDDPGNASNHVLLAETAQAIELEQAELDDLMREWEKRHAELEDFGVG